ncbi:MAG: 50S ribosomal protein L32 [Pyrinomonadaceae bacterium]
MPNPKRKQSKSRSAKRRSHDALTAPQYQSDKDTGEPSQPHRIDPKTGMYKGRKILDVREDL